MNTKTKKGSWIVTVDCKVIKEVICSDCTEEQARTDPFLYAEDERETAQTDWNVTAVHPNE